MKNKKILAIIVLVLLGFYWLLDHFAPLPLNHESFGLYAHNIHRLMGVGFFVAAGLVGWLWKAKQV